MRKRALELLLTVLTQVIAGGLAAFAASPLSGSFDVGIALNPNASSLSGLVQTDSDTYTKLTLNYSSDDWTVGVFRSLIWAGWSGSSLLHQDPFGSLS